MKILFYGGTGQCKVMRPIADKIGKLCVIIDDTENLASPFSDVKFYNGKNAFDKWLIETPDYKDFGFSVTIGNPHGQARQNLYRKLMALGLKEVSLIHRSAIIELYTDIGIGIQIHAGVIINPMAKIGDFCILNTKSLVEHDCNLSNGAELGPGATLCGNVSVGENSWIGAGAVVKQKINIGKNVIVGAGAVVVKDVDDNTVVVGVPAKPIRVNP